MSVYVVLVAAGRGERMGRLCGELGKAFLDIGGETPLRACARSAAACGDVEGIVAVVAQNALAEAAAQLSGCGKLRAIVSGGDTRQKSVLCGLHALPPECDIVLIHDAARVKAGPELFARCIAEVRRCGAAIPAIPVTDTVKVVEGDRILRTLDRGSLAAVQTPQGFLRADIEAAHRRGRDEGFEATDDAALLEHYGMEVRIFPGEASNIKLTTPEDLGRMKGAEARRNPGEGGAAAADGDVSDSVFSDRNPAYDMGARFPYRPRIGQGFDAHRLVPGRRLILCGVEILHERGLLGHSDADVGAHALMDALLSAAALGDIGAWFPDTDKRFRDADSMELLHQVVAELRARGIRVWNVDVTLIAQHPKLAPFRLAMRGRLAVALGIRLNEINVKFTTTEGMGWTGNGEGIAAMAVAMVGSYGGELVV